MDNKIIAEIKRLIIEKLWGKVASAVIRRKNAINPMMNRNRCYP